MGGELIAAAAAVVVGLLGLVGTVLLVRVQRRAAANEERLSRYESWDQLYRNLQQESDRFKRQRDEAWTANDELRRLLRLCEEDKK